MATIRRDVSALKVSVASCDNNDARVMITYCNKDLANTSNTLIFLESLRKFDATENDAASGRLYFLASSLTNIAKIL